MNLFGELEPAKRKRLSETDEFGNKEKLNLNTIIEQMTDREVLRGERPRIPEADLVWLANEATACFQNEPVCLNLTIQQPTYIVGDLLGQYSMLLHLFQRCGYPPNRTYIFLGNCVDRGRRSIETILLLFTLKLRYPNHIYLLRGMHECSSVAYYYGLYKECAKSFSHSLWEALTGAFDYLPAVAVIEKLFFCVSSGIPHDIRMDQLTTQDELLTFISDRIFRPNRVFDCDMMAQLAWSEPLTDCSTWKPNAAGLGWWYPESAVEKFCDQFNFKQVVRGNSMLPRGYEFMAREQLLTIYTSPYTVGHWRGYGAVAILTRHPQSVVGRIALMHFDTLAAIGRPNVLTVIFNDSLGNRKNLNDVIDERLPGSEIITECDEITTEMDETHYRRSRLTSLSSAEGCFDEDGEEPESARNFLPKITSSLGRRTWPS